MKKLFALLTALFVLGSSAAFASEGQSCKKCAGDKDAPCTCCKDKDSQSCDKDKKCDKPAPSSEKKS